MRETTLFQQGEWKQQLVLLGFSYSNLGGALLQPQEPSLDKQQGGTDKTSFVEKYANQL